MNEYVTEKMKAMYFRLVEVLSSIVMFALKVEKRIFRSKKPDISELLYSYYEYEAVQLGLRCIRLPHSILQIRGNNRAHNFMGSYTDLDGKATLTIAGDKALCYSMMMRADIPITRFVVIRNGDVARAVRFMRDVKKTVVIKPAENTGDATGVFLNLKRTTDVVLSVIEAGLYGSKILVEEFVEGKNYRLLFFKGKFLSACERVRAYVEGDGVSTVGDLIKQKNSGRLTQGELVRYDPARRPLLYTIEVTSQLTHEIKKQGFTLNSTPQKNTIVYLQSVCHWLKGGEYRDVTNSIAAGIVETSQQAVQLLGITLAGVDVISADISNDKERFIINEVNTTPGLLIHYEVQNTQEMRPVIKDILQEMFM